MCARFDKDELKSNGLACPFSKSDPERYKNQGRCHPEQGWGKIKDVSEHVWRCHAPVTRCDYCGQRWPSLSRKRQLPRARDEHIPGCREKHRGKKREVEYTDLEIMNKAQEEALCEVRRIKDTRRKLETLYKACGKPLPETYHVRPLVFAPPSRTGSNSSLLSGFQRPISDLETRAPSAPLQSPTLSELTTWAGPCSSQHGGPAGNKDSGYGGSDTQDQRLVLENANQTASPFSQWQPDNGLDFTGGAEAIQDGLLDFDAEGEDEEGILYGRYSSETFGY